MISTQVPAPTPAPEPKSPPVRRSVKSPAVVAAPAPAPAPAAPKPVPVKSPPAARPASPDPIVLRENERRAAARRATRAEDILRKRLASRAADLEAAAYPLLGWASPTGAASAEEKSAGRLKKAKKQRTEPAAEDAPTVKKQKKAKKTGSF